jgi:uncharacterized protein YdeI (YjbR/CyaY-like superfamily)
MGIDDYEQVLVTSRQQWRDWLAANCERTEGIWLITYKKASGMPSPSYDDIVEECLCFGWIDSTARPRDEDTAMQLITPRKPQSTWSAVNKARLERLLPSGLMTERGLQAIELAKANGSWELLDAVERLEVPADLADALDAVPAARAFFDDLPPGSRKQHLWHVVSAKRPATRAARVAAIVTNATEGRRTVG